MYNDWELPQTKMLKNGRGVKYRANETQDTKSVMSI